jgi:hypothetical protein
MSGQQINPAELYESPHAVLVDATLSSEQKRRVLEAWRQDAELMSQAEAENMGGGKPPRLREVKLALNELDKLPPRDDP